MLAFYVSRIVATLIHRAFFLLLADLCAGNKWFLINNFTGLVDFFFGADYAYLAAYQDVKFTVAGLGMPLSFRKVRVLFQCVFLDLDKFVYTILEDAFFTKI